MDKKKPNRWGQLLTIAFIVFLGLFIASKSGYYEAQLNNKVILTDKQIAKFEEDVLNGEVVDVNSYLEEDRKDYANNFTKAGDKFTEVIEDFITDGLGEIFEVLKTLFA